MRLIARGDKVKQDSRVSESTTRTSSPSSGNTSDQWRTIIDSPESFSTRLRTLISTCLKHATNFLGWLLGIETPYNRGARNCIVRIRNGMLVITMDVLSKGKTSAYRIETKDGDFTIDGIPYNF